MEGGARPCQLCETNALDAAMDMTAGAIDSGSEGSTKTIAAGETNCPKSADAWHSGQLLVSSGDVFFPGTELCRPNFEGASFATSCLSNDIPALSKESVFPGI